MNDCFSLVGKTAIVTGSSQGLGLAIARMFLAAGANVMVSSENATACAEAAEGLSDAGFSVSWMACDVASPGQQDRLVQTTLDVFGSLDILVANAGISGSMQGIGAPDHAQVMAVNLDSVVELCRLAIPHIKARGGGSIVLMSSIAALRGNVALGSYALSKAGLAQLARNIAVEFGPDNIRANAIAPGFIRTELAAPLIANKAFMAQRMQNTPLRRPGEPQEIASAALFLASSASSFVTGHTLVVDGGTTITDGN